MASNKVHYPGPGCLVEFLQGNVPALAVVLEEQSGRLRLYTQNRREANLPTARLLPWSGPSLGSGLTRQDMDQAMDARRARRELLASEVGLECLWELVQGEVEKASTEWLASLVWKDVEVDHEAALGRVLLGGKAYFRFNPPDFEIFPQAVVDQRLAEAETARLREVMAGMGAAFFQQLWDVYTSRRLPLTEKEQPEAELAGRLRDILLRRIADPDAEADGLWKSLIKGLPEHPNMALVLATAWQLVPEHYNFWLDRAGYERGDDWAKGFAAESDHLRERAVALRESLEFAACGEPGFISIDPEKTRDRDDAFFVTTLPEGGFQAEVALACPAAVWPFGGPLDRAVLRRASSLYLPEGDEHMLPAVMGWELFGLDAGEPRPALRVTMRFDGEGNLLEIAPRLCLVHIRANLHLNECEGALLQAEQADAPPVPEFAATEQSLAHTPMLQCSLALARTLQARRIASGAVITERPEPDIQLSLVDGRTSVNIGIQPEPFLTHMIVGELMIATNAGLAGWAMEQGVPLFYRTQDVGLPREFAGVWSAPQDIARVVRSLPPAGLEAQPRRHAGLGLAAYANVSSSLRRYVDLYNQGQIVSFLQAGAPRASAAELASLLPLVSARQDSTSQVQRFRPRYWKLLFFKQQGDKQWWEGVMTEENEAFATVALPWAQMVIRARRKLFDEKTHVGQSVQVRLGKVNPLLNEIQILESREY